MTTARMVLAGMLSVGAAGLAPAAAQDVKAACAGLSAAGKPVVTEATWIEAGIIDTVSPAPGKQQVPAHCLVRGFLDSRTGIDGKPYAIGYEIRLPERWNGKFFFQGGGGSDGFLRSAVGTILGGAPVTNGLSMGYAVASTDAGHLDEPGPVGAYLFGLDPQARVDKGYRHLPVVHARASDLIRVVYGRAQQRSYFVGCSNGGRQAMAATQRYPDLFDGVIAGAPAYRVSFAAIEGVSHNQIFASVAPRLPDGKPDLGNAFTPAEMDLVADGIKAACDKLDGAEDGIVAATSSCRFDPAVLQCKPGQNSPCLPEAKVKALAAMAAGRKLASGATIYSEWPWDPGIADPGWRAWRLGTPGKSPPDARNVSLIPGSLAYYFTTPPEPVTDLLDYSLKFDFDRDTPKVSRVSPPFLEAGGEVENAASTDIGRFVARGGKMIMHHGMADPIFSATDTVRYLEALRGRFANADSFARLYLVPGMTHCSGGPATDRFDLVTALDEWVEKGIAPGAIRAEARQAPGVPWPGRTRPLCPHPTEARYKGAGSLEEAASFECRAP